MKRSKKTCNAFHPKQLVVTNDFFLDQFSSESYLVVNKYLLQILGPNCAVLFSNLVDKYKYFRNREKLINGKWFYLKRDIQMKQTGLNDYHWNKSRKKLEDLGLIKTKVNGLPPTLHFRINTKKLVELLNRYFVHSENLNFVHSEKSNLDIVKNNISINTNNKETKDKETKYTMSDKQLLDVPKKRYSIDSSQKWNSNTPIDFKSFVDAFNEINDSSCRMSKNKERDIKKQLKTFTGQEIKKALQNRAVVLKGSDYLTSWESIFTRSIERMEKYLEMEDPKPMQDFQKDKSKNTTIGHKENYLDKHPLKIEID